MGTTLMRGVWIIGGMGAAMTDPGGKRTTEVIGGRGMTGTAETTAARTGGGIWRERVIFLSRYIQERSVLFTVLIKITRATHRGFVPAKNSLGISAGPLSGQPKLPVNGHRSLINRLNSSSFPHLPLPPPRYQTLIHVAILTKELFQSHTVGQGQERWTTESPVNVSYLQLLLFCITPFYT